ncbi:MAG: superoxide dismutase [Candidatus Omnitrophica bacterium]|nr:superoxide dismutase [Candidatus Omnitrophota bacterium]
MTHKIAYKPRDFGYLLGLSGFSDELLKNHFKLYEGYVKNTNELADQLASAKTAEEQKSPETAELRRRFGWEFNGMRLHEYYFGNMGRDSAPLARNSALFRKLSEQFGTFENWKKSFSAAGAMRGIGWLVLAYDTYGDRLLNVWINEHDTGWLVGSEPLLILDVFEHAFMMDYGMEKDKYIAAFWNAVHWGEVERRFEEFPIELAHAA